MRSRVIHGLRTIALTSGRVALSRVHVSVGRDASLGCKVLTVFRSINHSEITIIFAAPSHIPSLLKLAARCPVLKMVVAMEPLTAETKSVLTAWGETVNVEVKELSESMSCTMRGVFSSDNVFWYYVSRGTRPCQPPGSDPSDLEDHCHHLLYFGGYYGMSCSQIPY